MTLDDSESYDADIIEKKRRDEAAFRKYAGEKGNQPSKFQRLKEYMKQRKMVAKQKQIEKRQKHIERLGRKSAFMEKKAQRIARINVARTRMIQSRANLEQARAKEAIIRKQRSEQMWKPTASFGSFGFGSVSPTARQPRSKQLRPIVSSKPVSPLTATENWGFGGFGVSKKPAAIIHKRRKHYRHHKGKKRVVMYI